MRRTETESATLAVVRSSIDIDAYFGRIGYDGPRSPSAQTLSAIVARHAAAVPFENLDVLLGEPISLEPDAIERKIVAGRRGGYCFEQNGLLMAALETLGFSVTALAARVRMGLSRDQLPPRTHMFLRVDIDGDPWLADVGIGGLTPSAALRLDDESPQRTSHETHRVVREDGRHFHQALVGATWTDICEFDGQPMPRIDRELANWWTSTNPNSKFRRNLFVAMVGPEGTRLAIQNGRFLRRRGAETLESRDLSGMDELLESLDGTFGLHFPPGTRFEAPCLEWSAPGDAP